MALRVLHLVGSAVSPFYADLSRLYAQDCLDATEDRSRYEVHLAYVSPDRRWRFPTGLDPAALQDARPMELPAALEHLSALAVDVMVPQMFCLPGMTHYRALFDVLGIPYVGNAADVMALTANKARAKAVVAAAGVRVPRGELLRAGHEASIDPPVVVKPVDADNSLGVAFVREHADYDAALAAAFSHADEVLVEEFVAPGREVRCGLFVRSGELIALPLEEYTVDPASRPIRGHDDKLTRDASGALSLVAKDSPEAWIVDHDDPVNERVWELARTCHTALGCRHYSLFDVRIDPDGRPWFLEAGLYCSFARKSVISVMAAAAGIAPDELFALALAECTQTRKR